MTTEEAKELLNKLGISEFSVMEWNSVWKQIRDAQLDAYDKREYEKAEKLCELERFIAANGGEVEDTGDRISNTRTATIDSK